MDASGKAITHNGETLTWKAVGTDGHTFQAVTSGGLVVMTVSIPTVPATIAAHTSAEIGYQVTVHTNLDHGADNKLELTLAGRSHRQRRQQKSGNRYHHGE